MALAYFPMYGSYEAIFETLTDVQLGALVRGSLHYFNSGERIATKPSIAPLYTMLCRDIDYSGIAYEEKCEKRRVAARKRWQNNPDENSDPECNSMQMHANASKCMQNKDKYKDKINTNTNASARAKEESSPAPAPEREDCLAAEEDGGGTPSSGKPPVKEAVRSCGSFSNVPLTDAQLERLHREIPEADEYIDRLSEHIASTGKTYADCCATIFKWVREDRRKTQPKPEAPKGSFDTDDFFEAALERSKKLLEEASPPWESFGGRKE